MNYYIVKLILILFLTLPPFIDLFQDPEFVEARHFRLASLGIKESTIKTDLYYYNPNSFRLSLKTADLDVFINDRYAGHSLLDTLVHVPARDTFFVPVSVKVDMKNVFPNALSLLMNDSIDLRVEGKMKVGKAGIFVNIPVKYQEKQAIR